MHIIFYLLFVAQLAHTAFIFTKQMPQVYSLDDKQMMIVIDPSTSNDLSPDQISNLAHKMKDVTAAHSLSP